MAKTDVSTWSTNADANTDINGINIAENCTPSGINDAIRAIMSQIAVLLPTLVRSGASIVNDLMGAVNKRVGNGSTIYDGAGVERSAGYRSLPQTVQRTASYTFALTDVASAVPITTGGITIPANATVPFAVGDILAMANVGSASQSLTPASGVTLVLAGTQATGTRAVAQNGLAFAWKVATDTWWVYGIGVG